jgi:hypothetical protein
MWNENQVQNRQKCVGNGLQSSIPQQPMNERWFTSWLVIAGQICGMWRMPVGVQNNVAILKLRGCLAVMCTCLPTASVPSKVSPRLDQHGTRIQFRRQVRAISSHGKVPEGCCSSKTNTGRYICPWCLCLHRIARVTQYPGGEVWTTRDERSVINGYAQPACEKRTIFSILLITAAILVPNISRLYSLSN